MDTIDAGRIFIMTASTVITFFKYIITTINTYITINIIQNNDYNQSKAIDT